MKKLLAVLMILSVLFSLCACYIEPMDKDSLPVKTVLEYTQQTIVPSWAYDSTATPHSIECPALNADTTAAIAINDAIYTKATSMLDSIKSSEDEDGYIYQLSYEYTDYNGIVALLVKRSYAIYCSEWVYMYDVYYYDFGAGKQLSSEEYLRTLGITMDQVEHFCDPQYDTIHFVAADAERTIILYETINSPSSGTIYSLTEDPILD